MKHIYLFNNASRAAQYGIGTYIKELCRCLADRPDALRITIVAVNSERKEIEVTENEGIETICIPEITYQNSEKNYYKYYRNLAYILTSYIDSQESNLFLLNYLFMLPIVSELKRQWPDCKVFVAVHYLSWCFALNGNKTLFHQILSDEHGSANDNQAIYDEYLKDKKMFQQVDKVICLSRYTFDLLREDYQVNPSRISLIYNGLRDNGMLAHDDRIALKQRLGFSPNDAIILFVGRLDTIKGLEYLIRAFRKVAETVINARLLIVGNGNYDTYLKECVGIRHKVVFTGKVDKEELYRYYQIADLGVMPSFHEQCSYVAIEMMMHGIPLIGTDTTGLGEMIDNDLKITLDESSDSMLSTEALAVRITKVLTATDIVELRERSRNRFDKFYTIERMKEQYLKLLNIN